MRCKEVGMAGCGVCVMLGRRVWHSTLLRRGCMQGGKHGDLVAFYGLMQGL